MVAIVTGAAGGIGAGIDRDERIGVTAARSNRAAHVTATEFAYIDVVVTSKAD